MLPPLRVEIKSNLIQEISGTSKAGKPYHMRKQAGWAYTYDQMGAPNPYPERIEFSLVDGQQPYQPGNYTLSPVSFFVGDFHSLSISRPVLDPIPATQRPAA
ncbi:MAG: single-stranded DNA-binding protein [bacterium]|nr:single-stranded DNA-binding protein [bacterium]